jgi:hypothetical protein
MKTLARETVIYGGTTIIQRSLSWFLAFFGPNTCLTGGYGDCEQLQAWIALFLVLLIYGLETGFFRFAT